MPFEEQDPAAAQLRGDGWRLLPRGVVASAYVALSSWRGQDKTPERGSPGESGPHATFSVIEGGRARKRGKGGSKGLGRRSASHGSMMERFEERWRRRRDQNGY